MSDQETATQVRNLYDLSPKFDFDSYANWVAAHADCNQRKGFQLPDPVPAFLTYILTASTNAFEAQKIAEAIEADATKSKVLTSLERAIEKNDLTEADIRAFLSGLPVKLQKSSDMQLMPADDLFIAPGWVVTESRGRLLSVRTLEGR